MSRSASHPRDDYDRPGVTFWHRINRFLTILLVLGVVALVIGAFLPELQKQRIARDDEDKLKIKIEQRRNRLARQTRMVNWLKNDPGYVENIARDRLDLMKEGETIYRVEKPAAPAAAPPPSATPRALD